MKFTILKVLANIVKFSLTHRQAKIVDSEGILKSDFS